MEVNGILGILILALDIYAILKIAQSSASTGLKVVWILVVLLLPLLGVLAWFLFGPGGRSG
ncbi:MAG: PLDc N-terminal domain-containing protein [Gammaproteobacteria bacterium]|nr:PLDc N-terminal domain-containing protein [Gammaproteobacteria bacterium]